MAFGKLAGDAKREVAFQIGTARSQNQAPVPLRHGACSLDDGRFTHAGATFDDQDSTTTGENADRRQFRFAFEKPDHTRNGCLRDGRLQRPLLANAIAASAMRPAARELLSHSS